MTAGESPFVLGVGAAVVAILGCVQAGIGTMLLRRFVARAVRPEPDANAVLPPVTVLKPLHGDEPMLEQALESFCVQDYPGYQIVFGVQDPVDPAIAVVRALQARHPELALDLVVSDIQHGPNRKIGNLLNMMPMARHDVLVISDSDIHAEPTYLRAVTRTLALPGVGLVTTLYGGIPSDRGTTRRLAAAQVNHNFLPGVLMSRLLGRQDCLGATMALRRDTLAAIGGLEVLSPHLADDSALGRAVRAAGGAIAIADTLTRTTISDASLHAMHAHELRWGRTVRSVEPVGYALSSMQLPLFWAGLAVLMTPLSFWSWVMFAGVWLWRLLMARSIDRVVGVEPVLPALLLPVRDWMSALVMLNSFRGRTVAWRGHVIALPARRRTGRRAVVSGPGAGCPDPAPSPGHDPGRDARPERVADADADVSAREPSAAHAAGPARSMPQPVD